MPVSVRAFRAAEHDRRAFYAVFGLGIWLGHLATEGEALTYIVGGIPN